MPARIAIPSCILAREPEQLRLPLKNLKVCKLANQIASKGDTNSVSLKASVTVARAKAILPVPAGFALLSAIFA